MSHFTASWPHQSPGPWVSCQASESVGKCVQVPNLWLFLYFQTPEKYCTGLLCGCWRTRVMQPRSKRELTPTRQL